MYICVCIYIIYIYIYNIYICTYIYICIYIYVIKKHWAHITRNLKNERASPLHCKVTSGRLLDEQQAMF